MADQLDEFDIIARHFAPLARSCPDIETFRLMDDAATIRSRPGKRLVVTSDSLVAGIHFFGDEPPAQIAQKALRTNLSDLAAKGAEPRGYTMALHLPPGRGDQWLAGFAEGLRDDQSTYGISLLGGDTTSSPTLAIAITAIGEVDGSYPARQNAEIGDDVWVTGTIGDAALGLKLYEGTLQLDDVVADHLRLRYRLPQPRLEVRPLLIAHAKGAMDVSDGLLADLGKMCRAAKVGARVMSDLIPVSPEARQAVATLGQRALQPLMAGDDYEVLFTADPLARSSIQSMALELPFGVTRIGQIMKAESSHQVLLLDEAGNPVHLDGVGHVHRL
ncbi:MAG: thiamine-phosphate kinase [Pseudomonadota bacterium]